MRLLGDTFHLQSERVASASGHLAAIRFVRIEQGLMWSRCNFGLADGTVRAVDGIPNDRAAEMAVAIEVATREAIRRSLSPDYLDVLRAWLQRWRAPKNVAPDEWSDRSPLDALSVADGPPQPSGASIDLLLRHPATPMRLGLTEEEFADLQDPLTVC